MLIILTENTAVTPITIVTTPKSYNIAPAVYKNRSRRAYKSNSQNFASKRFSPSPSTPHHPQTENVYLHRFSALHIFHHTSYIFHHTSFPLSPPLSLFTFHFLSSSSITSSTRTTRSTRATRHNKRAAHMRRPQTVNGKPNTT